MRRVLATSAMAAAAAYPFVEPYRYRIAAVDVPVGRPSPLATVLHLSDAHLTEGNTRLQTFLASLARDLGSEPDLVLVTGDLIEDDTGIDAFVDAVRDIRAKHGIFYVLGSHDYVQAQFQSFAKYFSAPPRAIRSTRRADTPRFERGLERLGWVSLTNRYEVLDVGGAQVRLSGVDDPYIGRHEVSHIGTSAEDAFAIALVHAPDVVSEWALEGFDLVVAGHTHGGQVRLPLAGAVVTNCSLPTRLARGLNKVGRTWLHVSPGLGTSTYAPIRFLCRPEVTLLRLSPRLP